MENHDRLARIIVDLRLRLAARADPITFTRDQAKAIVNDLDLSLGAALAEAEARADADAAFPLAVRDRDEEKRVASSADAARAAAEAAAVAANDAIVKAKADDLRKRKRERAAAEAANTAAEEAKAKAKEAKAKEAKAKEADEARRVAAAAEAKRVNAVMALAIEQEAAAKVAERQAAEEAQKQRDAALDDRMALVSAAAAKHEIALAHRRARDAEKKAKKREEEAAAAAAAGGAGKDAIDLRDDDDAKPAKDNSPEAKALRRAQRAAAAAAAAAPAPAAGAPVPYAPMPKGIWDLPAAAMVALSHLTDEMKADKKAVEDGTKPSGVVEPWPYSKVIAGMNLPPSTAVLKLVMEAHRVLRDGYGNSWYAYGNDIKRIEKSTKRISPADDATFERIMKEGAAAGDVPSLGRFAALGRTDLDIQTRIAAWQRKHGAAVPKKRPAGAGAGAGVPDAAVQGPPKKSRPFEVSDGEDEEEKADVPAPSRPPVSLLIDNQYLVSAVYFHRDHADTSITVSLPVSDAIVNPDAAWQGDALTLRVFSAWDARHPEWKRVVSADNPFSTYARPSRAEPKGFLEYQELGKDGSLLRLPVEEPPQLRKTMFRMRYHPVGSVDPREEFVLALEAMVFSGPDIAATKEAWEVRHPQFVPVDNLRSEIGPYPGSGSFLVYHTADPSKAKRRMDIDAVPDALPAGTAGLLRTPWRIEHMNTIRRQTDHDDIMRNWGVVLRMARTFNLPPYQVAQFFAAGCPADWPSAAQREAWTHVDLFRADNASGSGWHLYTTLMAKSLRPIPASPAYPPPGSPAHSPTSPAYYPGSPSYEPAPVPARGLGYGYEAPVGVPFASYQPYEPFRPDAGRYNAEPPAAAAGHDERKRLLAAEAEIARLRARERAPGGPQRTGSDASSSGSGVPMNTTSCRARASGW